MANQFPHQPLIVYLTFLEKHASLKLYWPEFRRKYKAAPEMRDPKLTDKQREKWYRDFVNRMRQISPSFLILALFRFILPCSKFFFPSLINIASHVFSPHLSLSFVSGFM